MESTLRMFGGLSTEKTETAPMTDDAVDMVMERLEALYEET